MSSPMLIVPGWGGSGSEHWQTLWQQDLGAARVELADWYSPLRETWTSALEQAVAALAQRDPRPPVLVAHSLGCIAIAYWARRTRRSIRSAFFVAPADIERSTSLPLRDFDGVPLAPLPFSSLVVTSDDDPFVTADRATTFARSWGSDLRVIRNGGHLNASSGLGAWAEGRALLAALLARTEIARRELTVYPL